MDATVRHPDRNRLPLVALLAATAVSIVGNSFTTLSVPWFVLVTTGSTAKTGLTGAVIALSFVAAFLGGPLVDRLGFKRASIAADLGSGLAVALIPLLYHTIGLAFWQLLLLVFLRALCDTPGGAARQGLLPDVIDVAGAARERANGTYEAICQLSQLLGTASVGVLIGLLGAANVLWLDGITFFFSATAVFLLVPSMRRADGPSNPIARNSYLADTWAGIVFLRRSRLLWTVALVSICINLVGTGLDAVLLPVYAKAIYDSSLALGLLFAGQFGGYLIGSVLYAAVGRQLPRYLTFVGGVAALGIPFFVLTLQPPLWLALLLLAFGAILAGPLNPLIIVIAQEQIPFTLRGRVFGAMQAMVSVAAPLGAMLAGYAVSGIGLHPTLLTMGAFLLAVSGWAAGSRTLRAMAPPCETVCD